MDQRFSITQGSQALVSMVCRTIVVALTQIRNDTSLSCNSLKHLRFHQWLSAGIIVPLNVMGAMGSSPAIAQITSDRTLGNEHSLITGSVRNRRIEGGAIRGANLFHSFSEFDVNADQRVYFANPSGIANIFSRVTGSDVSNIMGVLGVDGGANLFLLNPNGIIFGPNARLDVSGSFSAGTSNGIAFPEGTRFSEIHSGAPPLLSVNVPLGVQFGPEPQGDIINAGRLMVTGEQSLTLYGRMVRNSGSLSALNGRIQILGDRIVFQPNSSIKVRRDTANASDISIDIDGQSIVLNNATLMSSATPNGRVGEISISAGDEILIVRSRITANGRAGSIVIVAADDNQANGRITVRDESEIGADGLSGNIIIFAPDRVRISDSRLTVESANDDLDNGFFSGITVGTTDGEVFLDNAFLSATNDGTGFAGVISVGPEYIIGDESELVINNRRVEILNHSLIESEGSSGYILITAQDSVEITESTIDARSRTEDNERSPGDDFNTVVVASQGEILLNGANLTTSNRANRGIAGNLVVTSDREILIENGTSLLSEGSQGELFVGTLPDTVLGNDSGLGFLRDYQIIDSERVSINNDSTLTVNNLRNPTGQAGSLEISAREIFLDDSRLEAETGFSPENGQGANIRLENLDRLLMRNGSVISARALDDANGGNVTIDAANGVIVAPPFENNDIIATAERGDGGGITIRALRLFGLSDLTAERLAFEQLQDNETSDISASSEFGAQGAVAFDILTIDPSQGLTELSEVPTDTSQQIAPGCGLGNTADGSEFIVTGRGGVPPSSSDPIAANGVDVPWVVTNGVPPDANVVGPGATQVESRLVEAQGIGIDAEGTVHLVAMESPDNRLLSTACTTSL